MYQTAPNALENTTRWIACRGWFSGQGHDAPAWLRVEDGCIREILSQPPAGQGRVSEEPSFYLAPLLSDTHVHVYMEPWPVDPARRTPPGSLSFEAEVERAIQRVDEALAHGVGLLRDMGDPHGISLEVKRRLARRAAPAPELLVAGPGFHRPKKYGRFLGVQRETVADILKSIDELRAQGEIDYVKVVTTGIVDFAEQRVKQVPQFTVAELTEVVAHAHRLGYKVAAHCSGADGLDINLAAGTDFIEHAYFARTDQIDDMATQGRAWTPTFAPVHAQGLHAECGWSEQVRAAIEAILRRHAVGVARAVSRGGVVLAGTDAGSPGVSMALGIRTELERLATAGIAAEQLLRLATVGNARALGARRYSPVVAPGSPATFALYAQCPWHDIRHLHTLRHVVVAGRALSSQTATPPLSP